MLCIFQHLRRIIYDICTQYTPLPIGAVLYAAMYHCTLLHILHLTPYTLTYTLYIIQVREWYSWHFPELKEVVKDNFLFAQCAAYIKVGSV